MLSVIDLGKKKNSTNKCEKRSICINTKEKLKLVYTTLIVESFSENLF